MTAKQFYDWQLDGGTDDVMRMVSALEKADVAWCVIGGVAVNNWALEPMVTQDVDFVVEHEKVERAIKTLEDAGFQVERRRFWVNFKGHSKVNIQLSMEAFYDQFPARAKPGQVHDILVRVAAPEDVMAGKIKVWGEPLRGVFKRRKDELDIVRLAEALPQLEPMIPAPIRAMWEEMKAEREAGRGDEGHESGH